MARVTTEDCIDKVSNRFELVMLAAFRARELSSGSSDATIALDNDKNPVVALREIAEETQHADALRERAITALQTQVEEDEPDDTRMTYMANSDSSLDGVMSLEETPEASDAEGLRQLVKRSKRNTKVE